MKKIRVAQIGTNFYSHGPFIWDSIKKQSEIFEPVGYALPERERERLPKQAERFEGYREYTVEELLKDPTIDAILVETDEIYLTKYALMAAKAGKHIHMEKPGGANLAEFEELIAELRNKTPEEIKRYQKIISNKEAILADAQQKADQIIAQAQIETNQLVSEHQIMQQAYAQANEVVMIATKQAQEILDNATSEANNIRMYAMSYTDDKLRGLEDILTNSIENTRVRYEGLINSLQGYLDVVSANRAELFPAEPEPVIEKKQERVSKDTDGLEAIDLSVVNIKND